VVVRVGRFGPYLERRGADGAESQRANLPDDLPPDELTPQIAEQLFATPVEGRSLGVDPVTGHEIIAKEGRFGPYVTEVLPGDTAEPGSGSAKKSKAKPRTGSLFKSMTVDAVTMDDALRLLSLPRVLGVDPATGQERLRVNVTLATGIPEEVCRALNLGYRDPATIHLDAFAGDPATLVVPRAGEVLFRLR